MKLLRDLPDTVGTIFHQGRECYLYSDGTVLPVIRGGDGSNDPPADPPGGAGGGDSKSNDQQTFSQAELNRIAAREKDEGKRAAAAEIAKQLGCTVEEAVEFIKQAKAKEDAEKTEAQKAKEAADKAKADADTAAAEAAQEKHMARIERSLLKAGVPDAKLDKVARMLDVEVGAEIDKIDEAAKDLKKEFPELFAGGKQGPPGSDPGGNGGKPNVKPNEDAFNRGAERAKQYRGAQFVGTPEGAAK